MFERFTDRARRVVVLAQEEARLLDHNYIGTEHILLGLVHEGESLGAQALTSMGIELSRVRVEVEDIIGSGGSSPVGHIPFTPRAKKVLELSLREALNLGHDDIGTEHILLGLVREGEGVGAQVLVKLGATPERVRARVMGLLAGWTDAPGATVETEPVTPPMCPSCRADLQDNLRQRLLAVNGNPPLVVLVVWCGVCGTTIGVLPPPPPAA